MKAVLGFRYGPPDVLELRDVEKPALEDGHVLIEVRASSGNAADWHGMKGGLSRLFGGGFLRPKDPRMGSDVAGRVEAVGPSVTRFRPGDAVFGTCIGAFAEYASAREDRLARKPPNVSFAQAGAAGIAGITALQGLRDKGRLRAGEKVLVNGASGGVGTFAVQIAKALGAHVTAVCSPRNLEQARALGADAVIDYTSEDFTRSGQRYDLIYDIVANRSVRAYKRVLNPGGRSVIVGVGFPRLSVLRLMGFAFVAPLRTRRGDKKVGFMGMAKINPTDLEVLAELMASGKLVPAIDRTFPLAQAAEAMRYLGTGHARGKVVVTVDHGEDAG